MPSNYRVQAGDTLWAISQKFGTTVAALMAANPDIANPDTIKVGQTIRLGCGGLTAVSDLNAPGCGAAATRSVRTL